MAEYIEREAALNAACDGCNADYGEEPCEPCECNIWLAIQFVPAADVVERPKWIPVTERLPDYPGRFMCYYEVNDYGEVGHCIDWGRYDPDDGWYAGSVTHWMPLPEPPKE